MVCLLFCFARIICSDIPSDLPKNIHNTSICVFLCRRNYQKGFFIVLVFFEGCILVFILACVLVYLSPLLLPPQKSLVSPSLMCQLCSQDTERCRQDEKRQLVPCELACWCSLSPLSLSDLLITPACLLLSSASALFFSSLSLMFFFSPLLLCLSSQLGCATTRCCAVRTAARATTISGATVPRASRVSCARELAARAPGSARTSCLDEPPSVSTPSASSPSRRPFCYWLFPFAERLWLPPWRPLILNQNPETTYVETGTLDPLRTWRTS